MNGIFPASGLFSSQNRSRTIEVIREALIRGDGSAVLFTTLEEREASLRLTPCVDSSETLELIARLVNGPVKAKNIEEKDLVEKLRVLGWVFYSQGWVILTGYGEQNAVLLRITGATDDV